MSALPPGHTTYVDDLVSNLKLAKSDHFVCPKTNQVVVAVWSKIFHQHVVVVPFCGRQGDMIWCISFPSVLITKPAMELILCTWQN